MAYATKQGKDLLRGWRHRTKFDTNHGKVLPAAYKKFYDEWLKEKPIPVHYVEKEGKYERNPKTGVVKVIQNVPLPLKMPKGSESQIWGGEAVIKGFQKRTDTKRRVPHWWVPTIHRTVLRSEVLDKYFSVMVTERAMRLIHENLGFDHYLLKTRACDLRNLLPIRMKKKILEALQASCPHLEHDPSKQKYIMEQYGKYLDKYTPEEIEWYGLTFWEAVDKYQMDEIRNNPPVPHKVIFREQLIEQLTNPPVEEEGSIENKESTKSWVSKLNPFSKDKKTEL